VSAGKNRSSSHSRKEQEHLQQQGGTIAVTGRNSSNMIAEQMGEHDRRAATAVL
jgi:hypothetical protein